MDTGKRKRIALAAGLFFLALLAGLFLTERAVRQEYENTARQMAALTRQTPEEEAVFAGILTGKTVEDSGDAVKAGMELLEKYGYELKDSFGAGALPGMVLMAASDEAELAAMIATSLQIDDRPSAFRYPRGDGVGVEIPDLADPLEMLFDSKLRSRCLLRVACAETITPSLASEGVEH